MKLKPAALLVFPLLFNGPLNGVGALIEIVPYDSNWPQMFEEEKATIQAALGDNLIAIHHIGSTAVPGLAAKPKIDIIAIAKDRKGAISALGKIGYQNKGEWNIPLKCGFTKRTGPEVNLHLFFDANHPEIELNLRFRDHLRTHPDVRDEYAEIKRQILQDEASQQKTGKLSFPVYTIKKSVFIGKIIETIGFDRLRVLKCLTESEQDAVRRFRKDHFARLAISDPLDGDLDDESHEHFILYRGTEIVGYADIHILPENETEICMLVTPENYPYFNNVISEWIEVHGYKCFKIYSMNPN
ncbi:MAG: GrpB family protein [Puniceicoccales bacterium]|jgi:GrpB-like predicted nucleotidyltransferase (UPF0157 family)|nr:GrpB family protein [Puniceicoccales bacterium]